MSIPPECQGIKNQIDSLKQALQSLQQEYSAAPASEKPFIGEQIEAVRDELENLNARLAECIAGQPPPPPPPPPWELVFTGVATITTTSSTAPGPFVEAFRLKVVLNGERTVISLTSGLAIKTDAF